MCSQPSLPASCDRETIPSRASILLLAGPPTLRKVSSASLWLLYEGPGITAPMFPTPQAGQRVGKTLSQVLQVMSRPCHDLVVHLFLHLANIYLESLLNDTCALPCPLGACKVSPVALSGFLWEPQPFLFPNSQALHQNQNPIPSGWVVVRCCEAFRGPGPGGRGAARGQVYQLYSIPPSSR